MLIHHLNLPYLTLAVGAVLGACRDPVDPNPGAVGPVSPGEVLTASALVAGTWTSRAPMPTRLISHTAGVVDDPSGQPILYVLGGWNRATQDAQKRVFGYNATTNKWTEKAPMPGRRNSMNGAATIKGRLYVSGGFNSLGRWTNTLFAYDPKTNKWSIKAPSPDAVTDGITAAMGDKLYVLSGNCLACPSNVSQRLWRYDPATNAWKRMQGSPHKHMGGIGGVINGKWYVAGGGEYRHLDVYDPRSNTWTILSGSIPVISTHTAGAVFANRLYMIGTEPDERRVWSYNPATNKWTAETPLPSPRSDAIAARVTRSGRPILLAVGGWDGTQEVATNEQYVR